MKKGEYDAAKEIPNTIVRAFVIIIVFLTVTITLDSITKKNTDVSGLEAFTLRNRLLYSKNCLSYNENERVIPGLIDINNFNHYNVRDCLKDIEFGIRLTLTYENKTKTTEINGNIVRQDNFCYDKSQVYCYDKDYFIIINEDNKIKNGKLRIEMVRLKRSTL